MKSILIIEDDEHILELLKFNIESAGYKTYTASDGSTGYDLANEYKPDLILLDLMLPGIDGIRLCEMLKNKSDTEAIPIIMLTAKGHESDKILGLESGADDYITKPFSIKELMTRIKVIFRRYKSASKIIIADIEIDNEKHEVRKNGEIVKLALKEYQLLEYLAENKGKVLTRNALLDKVWGVDYFGDTRTLDVHIRHIRKKINDVDSKLIETVRGVGYKVN